MLSAFTSHCNALSWYFNLIYMQDFSLTSKCKKKHTLIKSIRSTDLVSFLGFNALIIHLRKVDFKLNEIFIPRNNRNAYFYITGENSLHLKILMNLYYVLPAYLSVFGPPSMNSFDVNFIRLFR